MKAKQHALVTVRLPRELRAELDAIALDRGESLSLTVRDIVRAAIDARRSESPISKPHAGIFR